MSAVLANVAPLVVFVVLARVVVRRLLVRSARIWRDEG